MIVHKNPFFKIKFINDYYLFHPKNKQVIVLPIIDNSKILIIKVRRKHLKKNMYEFPSGSALSEKESIYASAKRELIEETGIRYEKKNKIKKLGNIYQMADRLTRPVYGFYINLNKNQLNYQDYDRKEIKSLRLVSVNQLVKLILKGEFNAAVPIALLFKYLFKLKKSRLIGF